MIEAEVRVYATLRQYLDQHDRGVLHMELAEGSTVADVLQRIGIPSDEVKQVFVDNRRAGLDVQLDDGARVSIFPPIAGGLG